MEFSILEEQMLPNISGFHAREISITSKKRVPEEYKKYKDDFIHEQFCMWMNDIYNSEGFLSLELNSAIEPELGPNMSTLSAFLDRLKANKNDLLNRII